MPKRSYARPTSQRRPTDWSEGFDAEVTGIASFAGAATGKVFMGGFTFPASVPQSLTLVRSRGSLVMGLVPGAASELLTLAVGIGIVNQDAVTAGAASLPGPLSDADWDGWLWHKYILIRTALTAATNAFGMSAREYEVDARAMRKFDSFSMSVFSMAEVTVNTITNTTGLRLATRHLWKT